MYARRERIRVDTAKKEESDMKDLFGITAAVMTITAMFVWGVTALAASLATVGRTGEGRKGEAEKKVGHGGHGGRGGGHR